MIQPKPPCDEAAIQATPCSAPGQGFWVLLATILGSSIAFIDSTVVNVALPVLQSELGATASQVQWVVESYALFVAALILVGGALGDRFGRRKVYVWGVGLFALASLWCGLAADVTQLIWARGLQGVGGALLIPGSLAIIGACFPNERRGAAIGLWSGFTAITSALGPVLGGWLIESFSWRWIFWLNLPLAAIVVAISLWRVPESRSPDATRLDLWGALLATVSLGSIVFGLLESAHGGAATWGIVIFGLLTAGWFLGVEARVSSPMLPLGLFRSRTFSGVNLLTFLLYGALGGALFFLPFNLIQVQGYGATAAGAALVPFPVLMFLLSRWSGGLVGRYGGRLPLIVGPTIAAIGFGLMALPGIGGSYWTTFFPAVLVLGMGMAICVAPLTTTVMNAVDLRYVGVASGVNNAVARVASLLAVALFGLAVLHRFGQSLTARIVPLQLSPEAQQFLQSQRLNLAAAEIPPGLSPALEASLKAAIAAAFVDGFRLAMMIAAGLALGSAVIAARMVERRITQGGE